MLAVPPPSCVATEDGETGRESHPYNTRRDRGTAPPIIAALRKGTCRFMLISWLVRGCVIAWGGWKGCTTFSIQRSTTRALVLDGLGCGHWRQAFVPQVTRSLFLSVVVVVVVVGAVVASNSRKIARASTNYYVSGKPVRQTRQWDPVDHVRHEKRFQCDERNKVLR